MSALDDLQVKAHAAREALDTPEQAAADLDSDTNEIAGQFAGLGNDAIAQMLQQTGADALSRAQEYIGHARAALDEYAAVCEQAKGTGGA